MKTSTTQGNISARRWFLIDAKGAILGRLASKIASLIRGKHENSFNYHTYSNNVIIVINAFMIKVTGKKRTDKKYYKHTGWIGSLKENTYSSLLKRDGTMPLKLAIKGMLPKNKLGRKCLSNIKIYSNAEHNHHGQNLIHLEL
jgi:large subunit ribosomal protein L13